VEDGEGGRPIQQPDVYNASIYLHGRIDNRLNVRKDHENVMGYEHGRWSMDPTADE